MRGSAVRRKSVPLSRAKLTRLRTILGAKTDADRAHWQLAEVSEQVLRLAERIVQAHGLRLLDAIHVASAQTAMTVFGDALPFITADGPQRDAATRIGLQVIWVS